MTLMEPVMGGSLVAYFMLPVATYAMGFDVSLTWGYVALFGLVPILLAIPTILPMAAFGIALGTAHDRLMQMAAVIVLLVTSLFTYRALSQLVHAPETIFQTAALILASPFILGVAIGSVGLMAILAWGIASAALKNFRSAISN